MRRAGQRARIHPQPVLADGEYAFLVGALIDAATLQRAEAQARTVGVGVHDVLLATGWVDDSDYAGALARTLGVSAARWDSAIELASDVFEPPSEAGVPVFVDGLPCRLLSAAEASPRALLRHVTEFRERGILVAIAPPRLIEHVVERHQRHECLDNAVAGLLHREPVNSAAQRLWMWQMVIGASAAGVVIGGIAILPEVTLAIATGLIALPFLCITLLRLVALTETLSGSARSRVGGNPAVLRQADLLLPTYTVLVPLLREGNVLPDLICSLRALDYPATKLEVFLILEGADTQTQDALTCLELPGNFRVIVVPDAQPRTKPKALNYALQFARGDYVVVYDAEDRPEPDQLRRAVEGFRRAPPGLGCLQAQLNIYNPWESWFTRQFTIEYSALFDAVLPALERLRLPVPLGGTSNHFPRATLQAVGGWDPFNVTEDADLGIRLARRGYHTGVLSSTTWEEAPVGFGTWLKQRTRWLKGWMQTYLVHTRELWRLNAELGPRGAIGFHALMGGLILSALVHPLFYLLLACQVLSGAPIGVAETAAGKALLMVAWLNLAAGYLVSMAVGALSVCRRRRPGLALRALLMPVYWLMISLAAYRAAYQLVRDPYLWEKTEHGVGRRRRRSQSRIASD